MNVHEVRVLPQAGFPFDLLGESDRLDIVVFSASVAGIDCLLKRAGVEARVKAGKLSVRVLAFSAQKEFQQKCLEKGVLVRFWGDQAGKLHAKGFIGSGRKKFALVGSSNLSRAALTENVEFMVRGDDSAHAQLSAWFVRKWEDCKDEHNQYLNVPVDIVEEDLDLEQLVVSYGLVRSEPMDFQRKVIDEVWDWIRSGPFGKGRMACLPTGAGKTLIAVEVVRQFLDKNPGKVVLWTCHTVQPLVQAALCFARQTEGKVRFSIGAAYGSSVSKRFENEHSELFRNMRWLMSEGEARVVFCTYDALGKPDYVSDDIWSRAGFLVVDEAHRFSPKGPGGRPNERLTKVASRRNGEGFKGLPLLGLTATPDFEHVDSLDRFWHREGHFGSGLVAACDNCRRGARAVSAGQPCLCCDGFIARRHPESWAEPTGFKFWMKGALNRVEFETTYRMREFNSKPVNDAVVRVFGGDAPGGDVQTQKKIQNYDVRRVLVFVGSIVHAVDVVGLLGKTVGSLWACKSLHSGMDHSTQAGSLGWFKEEGGDRKVLVTVMMAAEGLDLPKIDCVVFVRPTYSPILLHQMEGRGLRGPKMGGTEQCLFVDLVHQFVNSPQPLVSGSGEDLAIDPELDPEEVEGEVPSGHPVILAGNKDAMSRVEEALGRLDFDITREGLPRLTVKNAVEFLLDSDVLLPWAAEVCGCDVEELRDSLEKQRYKGSGGARSVYLRNYLEKEGLWRGR